MAQKTSSSPDIKHQLLGRKPIKSALQGHHSGPQLKRTIGTF